MNDERGLADAALAAREGERWPAVAQRVREARERAGLSEDALASLVGISAGEYQDIEFHDDEAFMCFSVTHLARLAAIVGVPLEQLLCGHATVRCQTRTSFAEIAARLSARATTEGLTIDELGDNVGWELGGVIAEPGSLGEFNVQGLYDVCTAVGVNWVSALPIVEADRPTTG